MPKRARPISEGPSTPTHEGRQNKEHFSTPTRAKIQGTVEYLEKKNIVHSKADVFDVFGVKKREGWRILAEKKQPRRHHNDPFSIERRGRPSKITKEDISKMDKILQDYGMDGRILTWEQLAIEADIEDVSGRTIRRHIHTIHYRKCLACKKDWVSKETTNNRIKWAESQLSRHSDLEYWHTVRFSDEMHSGYGAQHTLHIIRRPGERYCPDCIQHAPEPDEKDKKRQHCWGAAGYNFKSQLKFYEVSSNTTGKMSQQVYRDVILESMVKPWVDAGQHFVLEEDGDSGHGPSSQNIVRTWKQQHGVRHYFNCANSPDLAPIENCWQAPKQTLKKYPHWDDNTTRELIREGWDDLQQKSINKWIDSMPQRLQDVIDSDGQLTGH